MKNSKNNKPLPDWNRDEVWEKIEVRLQNKKRRRVVAWWWFGLGLLLVGTGFYISNSNQKTPIQASEKLHFANNPKLKKEADSVILKKESINLKNASQNTDNQFVIKNNSPEKVLKKQYNTKQKTTVNFAKKRSVFLENVSNKVESIQDIQPKIELPPELTEKPLFFEKLDLKISFLKIENSIFDLENPTPKTKEIDSEKAIKKSNSNKSFFVETGVMTGNVNYYGDQKLSDLRSTTETFRFALDFTTGVEKVFNKNWFVKTGLTYRSIFEKYEHETDSLQSIRVVQSDSATIYNLGNGNLYVEPGVVREETTLKRAIVHNNFTHRLSIPVTGGYVFRKGKMSFAPELGLRVRVFQKHSGVIAYSDSMHGFENDWLYNNFDLGLIGGISGRYQVSKRSRLAINLRFEQEDFLKISSLENGSRHQLFGGNLGWYFEF